MTLRFLFPCLALGGFAVAMSRAAAADAFPPEQIEFFEKNIRPVLAERCHECHGADKHQNGLRLDSRAAVLRGSDYGKVVEPGNPSASKLIKAITHAAGVEAMPKKGDKLSAPQIAAFEKWISLGLPWPVEKEVASHGPAKADPMQHWAYKPVQKPALPAGATGNPIDALVGAKLKAAGLDFAPPAAPASLVRRFYVTLTGLPPSYEQLQAGLRDPQALVPQLLARPGYGEKWGRMWLDVVRYADTNGYQVAGRSNFYPYAFTYRDWVVKALNDDMPYDQFVSYQLAADRLTAGTPNSPHLAALGFYNVGERFINDKLLITDDRIDVVGRGLLGITIGCARCHDHKFDPIPSRDYYALYSIFNSSEEPDDPQLPVIGKAANEKDAKDYDAKVAEIDAKTLDFKRKVHAESTDAATLPQCLVFAQEGQGMDGTAFRGRAGQLKLRDRVCEMWRDFLKKNALTAKPHPVMLAWKEFAALPAAQFVQKAPEVSKRLVDPASGLNAVLRNELPKRTLKSLSDVATLYRDTFVATLSGKEADNGDWRQIRELLQNGATPYSITPEKAETFFTRKDRETVVRIENERTKLDSTHPGAPPRAMVLLDKPKPQDVRVFMRGNPARQGDPAPRAWLTMFGGEKFTDGSGRLELAKHVASKDNPLTARVIVNRVWMQHFGKPLVSQPSDFGVQTPKPVQADVLDYLASYLMENGWSLKKLHTLILTSRTYQQSSHATADKTTKDADNELLSRFNRQRLDYETMRDALLAASGELDMNKHGGRAVELNAKEADTFRTLYLKVDRYDQATVPAMFDFANPEGHSPQRFNTTVPQQALFLMNSPFMRGRADAIAKTTTLNGSTLDSEAIRAMYRRIINRDPRPDEVELAQRFAADATALNAEKPFRWSYGTLTLRPGADGKPAFSDFQPFAHLTERAGGGQKLWSPEAKIPSADPKWGHAFWANYGGHAAPKDLAVTARWHVPTDLKVTIDATLSRKTDRGDGVRAWIHNSRTGVLSEYLVTPQNKQLPTHLTTEVKKGDILSFIVHNEKSTDSDSFEWQPRITNASGDLITDAKNDFCDASRWPFGRQKPQSPLSQLAQVLLMSNEFMFVD
ncbi:MAG: PSD1 domain-containing protein [Prosthecobacter sp.]|jgi:mono/diheme cytochrome c family protein|uniref:PSD1 and planctomycete cytochrome C domain-containing protein n=1 Tax=Prosthecobacter sp. TaxID=1965333 RepID=UPI001A0A8397|nr:PSD1 and planctomycete cytochrome C domain-containing protein [Prosthecobacter sp.]MBE2287410.1 PSD1 domain-containing protein [Prosthecobacter sp.]